MSGSTNGTTAWIPANSSGARLATAPMSIPPALPPSATSRSGEVSPESIRCRAQSTKSVNVLRLDSVLPFSYQSRPISPPPRTCATANAIPRSRSESLATENAGSILVSYEPYPYNSVGTCSPASMRAAASTDITREIGTRVPSAAVAQSRRCTYPLGS